MRIYFFTLLLIFGFSVNTIAQEQDFGCWGGITLNKKITSKLSADFTEQIRTSENSSRINKILSQIGVNYKFSKYFKLNLAYRFSQNQNLNFTYNTANRFQSDLNFYYKYTHFKFSYRLRFQNQYENIYTSETGKIPTNIFRQKGLIQFDYGKRFVPGISAEFFYNVKEFIPQYLTRERYRMLLGYDINDKNKIELFYQFQNQWASKTPVNSYVVGIFYRYEL